MAIVFDSDAGTITGLSVGGLPDGIVDAGTLATNSVDSAELIDGAVDDSHMAAMAASKLTGALPAISGASLTGLSAGITNHQIWVLTTQLSLTGNSSFTDITANLAECTATGYARVGSAMAVSSGVFTFPETGIWAVTGYWNFVGTTGYARGNITATTNNSSYSIVAQCQEATSTQEYAMASATTQVDVTDVTNVKVIFQQGGTAPNLSGSSSFNRTYFVFTRIGDT